jgi:hypothetical protein
MTGRWWLGHNNCPLINVVGHVPLFAREASPAQPRNIAIRCVVEGT